MARPQKKGLDYYPQDTDIHTDRKIRRLLNEFGATGYLVYDYVKTLCYRENGYWLKYDDGFCFDVADVLKSGTTENSVTEILKGCFRMSLFSSEVFKAFRIITSKGIQERFLKAKKGGLIDEQYNCLGVNSAETPESGDLSTQSKRKKSKENESKVPTVDEVVSYFLEKGYSEVAARKAHEYYQANNWHDSHGHQVLSWKQKMISNWFKPEHLITPIAVSATDEATKRIKDKMGIK